VISFEHCFNIFFCIVCLVKENIVCSFEMLLILHVHTCGYLPCMSGTFTPLKRQKAYLANIQLTLHCDDC